MSFIGVKVIGIIVKEGEKFEFVVYQWGMYKFCFNNFGFIFEIILFYIYVGYIYGFMDFVKDGEVLKFKFQWIMQCLDCL